MFGYEDAELERIRRGPRGLRLWVLAVQLLLASVPCGVAVVAHLFNDPVRLLRLVNANVAHPGFQLGFLDMELLPIGTWRDPWSWKLAITGFWFKPDDPKRPDWEMSRATIDVPWLMRAEGGRVLRAGRLAVNGLAIHAHQQRPPDPWEPRSTWVHALMVDVVVVRGAAFESPEDPPLGVAAATDITGELHDLVFVPGLREVSGRGTVKVGSFTTGSITVVDGVLSTFELDHSTLRIEGTYLFAGAQGWVKGEIRRFHIKSEVAMHTILRGASVARVVETATGSASNIDGKLDLDLNVEAGGDRPRGSARLHGSVAVVDGRIQLGENTRYLVLDALRLLPWVELNASRQVELRPLDGRIELSRGRVTLMEWRYPVGKRSIRVDGTLDAGDIFLFVRLLPREDREDGRAIGLVMWGDAKSQQVKLADRDALARPDPWRKVIPERWDAVEEEKAPRRAKERGRDKPAP